MQNATYHGTALVGSSGFVGTTLQCQTEFDALYRSSNIQEIKGASFDRVICAAAPAQKWIANRQPDQDRENIESLIRNLGSINCRQFILISTVDVFMNSIGVDEDTVVDESGLHPYGRNRRLLERFVEDSFSDHLIVRLPGLVGPGLRKNVIYDFLNSNNLSVIDSRGVFQFYPMVNLWGDLKIALTAGLRLVHLTAEPVSVADASELGFYRAFHQELPGHVARYDMQTRHADLFGGRGLYQYSRRESIQAIRAYAQSEPRASDQKISGGKE